MGWEARERLAWQEVMGPGLRWCLGCEGQSRVTLRWEATMIPNSRGPGIGVGRWQVAGGIPH